jgi:hypothetical protein
MAKINARTKGANGEREVADILQRVVNEVAIQCGYVAPRIRRNTEQSQIGGEDLVGLPWYSIEVKRVERVDLPKWWAQTVAQAGRKAAGSSSWDALVRGGWKQVAAGGQGVGSGPSREAGAAPGQGEAGRAVLGPADGFGAVGLGQAGFGQAGTEGRTMPAGVQEVQGGPREGNGLSLPVWATGGPVEGPTVDRGPREVLRPLEGPQRDFMFDGNADSSPLKTRESLVGVGHGQGKEIASKAIAVAREPVLIWRQSRQPWNVRCVLDIDLRQKHIRMVADVSLDDWLEILRDGLAARLRG